MEELPRLEKQIRDFVPLSISAVAEAIRIGYVSFDVRWMMILFTHFRVTEEPFKIPYYAALIRLLHERTEEPSSTPPIGRQLLEDFWKGFQAYLDKLAWRETRLCVILFPFD